MLRVAVAVAVALCAVAAATCGNHTSHRPCTCNDDLLDCSYRNLTVLPDAESCDASIWNLRGNHFRKLPNPVPGKVIHLDLSDTGLVGNVNLDALAEFPSSIRDLHFIDLSFNHIKSLNGVQRMVRSSVLVTFNASNNMIEKLEMADILPYMVTFRIANNRIRDISNELSPEYSDLEYLDLSGNPLQVVSERAFENLSKLRVLRLDETRILSTLLNGTFSGVVNLQCLYLAGNALESLPSGIFENLQKLEILELQRNSLQNLPDDLFRNLFSLRMLILDDNRLELLQDTLFAGLHSLEDLSVRGNRLTALPSLHFCWAPLQRALFDDNRIQEASEMAVRSLLRPGFRLGDLRGNSIPDEALQWIQNTSDVTIKSAHLEQIQLYKFMVNLTFHPTNNTKRISLWVKSYGEIVL